MMERKKNLGSALRLTGVMHVTELEPDRTTGVPKSVLRLVYKGQVPRSGIGPLPLLFSEIIQNQIRSDTIQRNGDQITEAKSEGETWRLINDCLLLGKRFIHSFIHSKS